MRFRSLALPASALVVLTSITATTAPASAAGACSGFSTGLHQLVHAKTGASLVTVYSGEASKAVSKYGYTDRGVVAEVADRKGTGLVDVHRLRKGADYEYVAGSDVSAARSAGYAEESVPFYGAAASAPGCSTPVHQLTSKGKHRLASGTAARDTLVSQGWSDAGVLFYAAGSSEPTTGTPTSPDPSEPPAPPAPPQSGRPVPKGPTAGPLPAKDSDTTFTIAVLPDIQRETHKASDPRIANRSQWLADNKDKLDLRFAAVVGDIADWDSPDHDLYANAAQGLLPLQAAVPMAAAPGNHDTAAVCAGGSACPGAKTWITVRDTKTYNGYFPASRFGALAGTYEKGKTDNAYHQFRAGGKDWMVINLELWPRKEVVAWAADLVKDNPKKNVIIVTHSYLESNGKISTSNGGYGSTTPAYLYDQVVKPFGNVKLVLSGHTGKGATRTDVTSKGTTVASMLQCFHSMTTNPVRLVQIDTKAGTMKTWVYAPYTNESWKQFDETTKGLKFVG
ncbi:3',5'-cyclic AMP phosphodiesterase CpdA [Microlunatus sagamiharensis]|uniref:3',5'-cyclic AMP phosphodiesterase CpdA n=1 Tax=Microlunatus sagamiharensis TaxID=546874 RepID=A0A1H2NG30_9ACTN|nr:metallophosphoesterase [Microlunatus sagamiharensis]SDV04447.1 3',5'-cyclic AMP phosphodiesterase CpdA [Microlunatus sagamiharensis]